MVSTSPRVLVTGASGFVGWHLTARLAGRVQLTTLGRSAAAQVRCDLSRGVPQPEDLEGFDCVLHLAGQAHAAPPKNAAGQAALMALNCGATRQLAANAAAAGVRRFVYVSTSKVLGERGVALTEQAPLQPQGAYAQSKAAAEQALTGLAERAALQICIVRPPLVYGPGVRANFAALLRLAAGGWPLPLASARAPRSLIGVANLAQFLADRVSTGSGIYHVTDTGSVSVAELIRELRSVFGQPSRLWPVTPRLARFGAALIGRGEDAARLFDGLELSDERARRELAWQPPATRSEGLRETIDWYRSNHNS